ncbi:MAG TPA: ribosome maturation factor RimP [Candidatus Limnocylindrales bacterium]|nr:ribosome maturation factor RimP [Candidatus Limnocylindrales bacterium]
MATKGRLGGRQHRQPDRKAAAPRPTRPAPVDVAPIRAVIEQAVTGEGYEVDSLSVKPVGRRHLVRVTIDGDGGLGLDVIADVSRAISAALDAAEETGKQLIEGEYQLEVSSPGVDRPLTTPAHWRRNIGRLVKVKAGERIYTGRVVTANDQGITLDVAGIADRLDYRDLGPGRVQIEFNRLDEVSDDELAEFDDEEER